MDNKCLVFATNNNHKLEEINSILNGHFNILSLKDINCFDEIEETSNTLEGNAAIKARYINSKYHYNCFADDTGLEVFSLDNEPGVYSARYAYKDKNDSEANIDKLLHKLENISDRRAQFRTAIALIIDEKEYFFEGIIKGTIAHKRAGMNGFGYDSIFIPEGYDKTFAQLGSDVKNNISHRARAIQKLTSFLTEK